MLANAYIPAFAIIVGVFVANLTVIPSLILEAFAVRSGTYRESARARRNGRVGEHPAFALALLYAIVANVASTMPGLVTAFYFLDYNTPLIWLIHYIITVAIELPVFFVFGIQFSAKFVVAVLGANTLTYALMYGLVLLLG